MGKASAKLIAFFVVACLAWPADSKEQRQFAELVVQTTVPQAGSSVAFGFDALWVMGDNVLLKVNPADNSSLEIEIPTSKDDPGLLSDLDRYRGIAGREGAVWIPDMASSTIYKLTRNQTKSSRRFPPKSSAPGKHWRWRRRHLGHHVR